MDHRQNDQNDLCWLWSRHRQWSLRPRRRDHLQPFAVRPRRSACRLILHRNVPHPILVSDELLSLWPFWAALLRLGTFLRVGYSLWIADGFDVD